MTNEEVVARFCSALEDAFSVMREDGSPRPWEDLMQNIADLSTISATIAFLKAESSGLLYESMPEWEVTLDGVGTFTKSSGRSKVTTDGKRLAHRIAARVSDEPVDLETGEILPPAALAAKVADELIDCGGLDNGSHKWRSGKVKLRGLSLDDFSDSEPGTPTVIFKRAS